MSSYDVGMAKVFQKKPKSEKERKRDELKQRTLDRKIRKQETALMIVEDEASHKLRLLVIQEMMLAKLELEREVGDSSPQNLAIYNAVDNVAPFLFSYNVSLLSSLITSLSSLLSQMEAAVLRSLAAAEKAKQDAEQAALTEEQMVIESVSRVMYFFHHTYDLIAISLLSL